jgi:multiple sugar transport system substrate-binding protein
MLMRTLTAGASAALFLAAAPMAARADMAPLKVDQPVTITYYNYNLAAANNGQVATKRLIAEFEAANPNVKVNGVGASSAEIMTKVQADVAAGRSPDVVQLGFGDFDFIVDSLGAVALEDIVPADELKAHFEGISPKGLRLGQRDGKTYGLAYTFSTPVLFYNAELFRKAGLDPDHPPQTWDQVKQAALAIQQKTGAKGFLGGIMGPSAGDWMLQGIIRSNGGDVLSDDRKTLTFADPASVDAIRMLRDLHDAGIYNNNDVNADVADMANGTAGMYLQTSAIQAALVAGATAKKFELRNTTMPTFGDKPARPNNSGSALFILTHDPVKERAAWELMKFMTSKHAYTVITSEIGYLPLRTDIVDDPAYLGDWVKAHPLIQPNLKQLAILEPWKSMPGPNYHQVEKLMTDAIEQAVIGKGDVAQTLKSAQDQAQQLMP